MWEATYLPFGGVHTITAQSVDLINLRFPGQWFQSESGLHQNWMRDYDPTLGRYIQADPLGLVDGASVYGYALQNPGRYVDPRGEQSSPNGSTPIPGTGMSTRVDPPKAPNQQTHAHIFDRKGRECCVINQDGTQSHKGKHSKGVFDRIVRNKKIRKFLSGKGFKFGMITFLEYCLPTPREMRCIVDPISCHLPET